MEFHDILSPQAVMLDTSDQERWLGNGISNAEAAWLVDAINDYLSRVPATDPICDSGGSDARREESLSD